MNSNSETNKVDRMDRLVAVTVSCHSEEMCFPFMLMAKLHHLDRLHTVNYFSLYLFTQGNADVHGQSDQADALF